MTRAMPATLSRPPCGEGVGGGGRKVEAGQLSLAHPRFYGLLTGGEFYACDPHPQPLPARGRGERRALAGGSDD